VARRSHGIEPVAKDYGSGTANDRIRCLFHLCTNVDGAVYVQRKQTERASTVRSAAEEVRTMFGRGLPTKHDLARTVLNSYEWRYVKSH
jgi:hypothetical protein